MRYLDVKNMQVLQDYAHSRYFVKLSPGDTYADLFVPTFWAYHRGKLSAGDGTNRTGPDLIRVRAHDGSFDVALTVVEVKTDGVVMQRWPVEPSAEAQAQATEIGKIERVVPFGSDGKPVVRIGYLEATKWRVIGLHSEVSSGHKDEASALRAMADYLKGIRYVMPSAESQAEALREHEAKLAAASETAQARRTAPRK